MADKLEKLRGLYGLQSLPKQSKTKQSKAKQSKKAEKTTMGKIANTILDLFNNRPIQGPSLGSEIPMISEDWLKTKKKKNNKSIAGGF